MRPLSKYPLAVLALLLLALADPVPALSSRTMGYGVQIADLNRLSLITGMGFNWTRRGLELQLYGASDTTELNNLKTMVTNYKNAGVRTVLMAGVEPWIGDVNSDGTTSPNPALIADFADRLRRVATALKGLGVAYEIGNEPNLNFAWRWATPNPEHYAEFLKAAYPVIKAADPDAKVITAGLSTVGTNMFMPQAMDDADFIQRMYNAGARGYFDALGSHPYGFGHAPEDNTSNPILSFRRAETHRQIMVNNGDTDKTIWATEFGWIIDPSYYGMGYCLSDPSWDGRQWQRVSPQQQADYLVRAYNYAFNNWSWMEVMLVFNLEFPGTCDQMHWYAITNSGAARPAYTSLSQMSKPGIAPPSLALNTGSISFLLAPSAGNEASKILQISNSGGGALQWTASTSGASWLSLGATSGTAPSNLEIRINKNGLSEGTYTATVTVSTSTGSRIITVTLYIGPISNGYLPIILRTIT